MHRSRLASVLAALIGVAVAFGTLRGALAQATDLSFTWKAPPECPDEGYVRGAIDRLLAGGPRTSSRVDARAEVARSGARWRVTLVTVRDGASGQREVEAGSCRSLADATALIVALTVDPTRVAANRPQPVDASSALDAGVAADAEVPSDAAGAPPIEAPVPPPPATTPPPNTPPQAAPRKVGVSRPPSSPSGRRPEIHGALFALLGGDRGTLPSTAYGVALGGALLIGPLRVEVYGSYWPPQYAYESRTLEGGSVRLYAGGVRGGYGLTRERIELMPCVGFEGGALYAEGINAVSNGSATGPWLALTGDARVSIRLAARFRLAVDLGFGLPLRRDSFVLDKPSPAGQVTVHEAYWIVGRAFVGPEVRF
jgi:hypothetical protein